MLCFQPMCFYVDVFHHDKQHLLPETCFLQTCLLLTACTHLFPGVVCLVVTALRVLAGHERQNLVAAAHVGATVVPRPAATLREIARIPVNNDSILSIVIFALY